MNAEKLVIVSEASRQEARDLNAVTASVKEEIVGLLSRKKDLEFELGEKYSTPAMKQMQAAHRNAGRSYADWQTLLSNWEDRRRKVIRAIRDVENELAEKRIKLNNLHGVKPEIPHKQLELKLLEAIVLELREIRAVLQDREGR